ncbi:flagellar basal body-associated FliL family protein [Sphingomonas mollis]|uniref:flagellar basal body-associated FliL family protein n=1 Tax=Sphingomonas mollis TaxID=2795726 RepID=UPI002FCE5C55
MSNGLDIEEVDGAKPPPARNRKKLVIIGAAAAVLLLGGGGGAYMMMGGTPAAAEEGGHGDARKEVAAKEDGGEGGHGGGEGKDADTPFDVPPLLVNLRTADGTPHFLKVHVMLVPGPDSSLEGMKDSLPVLLDAYQPFLRELRPEDLSGSAAVFRIKEELLVRSRAAIGEGKVKEILVQDLIQQ